MHVNAGKSRPDLSSWNKLRDYSFMKGENNPSKRLEVRQKISISKLGKNNTSYKTGEFVKAMFDNPTCKEVGCEK